MSDDKLDDMLVRIAVLKQKLEDAIEELEVIKGMADEIRTLGLDEE